MIFVGVGVAAVFVLLGWAIKYKGAYWLIAGYNTMSPEKKGKVDTIGLGRFMGNMIFILAAIILAAFVSSHLGLHLAGSLAFVAILPVTIFIIIKAQKYDGNTRDPQGRMKTGSKTAIIVVVLLLVLISLGIGVALYNSGQPAEFSIQGGSLEISGMYGQTIPLDAINNVELLDTMPQITRKNNGLDVAYVRKGRFSLAGQGQAILNVNISKPPFIRLDTDSGLFFINGGTSEQTQELYHDILEQLDR